MTKFNRNRRPNGQFAPNLLGKNAPTPSALLAPIDKVPNTPYEGEMSAYYWSHYQATKRRNALAAEYPNLFPEGGSWYEDSSDEDTIVYLYVSPNNAQPLRWVQVDRFTSEAYRVLEMTPNGTAREILSAGITSAAE